MFEIIIVVVVLAVIYYRTKDQKHREKYKAFYNLPTPFYVPIIGNTYLVYGKNILNGLIQLFERYGNPCLIYFPHTTYCTARPNELKILLNHPNVLEKSAEYNHLKMIFGKSLLIAPVDQWKKHRKLISRSFKQTILDSFVSTFYEKTCILNRILKAKRYDEDDIYHLFEKFTLDTFCEATLGIESTILNEEKDHMFVTALTFSQRAAFERVGNILKMNDFLFSLMPVGIKTKKNMQLLLDYISQIMDKKRITLEENKEILLNLNKLPVLDLLLQVAEKEHLKDDYIQEEMVLFAGAATDTTAYSMAYTCCLLGMHPEVQEKVYQEVMSVVGQDREINNNDLVDLKYTEMAISEAQRLLPVIPIIARKATADVDLGDKVIPADTGIIISLFDLHRNKEFYPDPLVYDPNRFLPEEIAKRPQYSFLPFSGGPRNCIGLKYASMLMRITIANIVRNFKISTKYKSVHELKFISSIVMSTTEPLDCHFTSRLH